MIVFGLNKNIPKYEILSAEANNINDNDAKENTNSTIQDITSQQSKQSQKREELVNKQNCLNTIIQGASGRRFHRITH